MIKSLLRIIFSECKLNIFQNWGYMPKVSFPRPPVAILRRPTLGHKCPTLGHPTLRIFFFIFEDILSILNLYGDYLFDVNSK